MPRTRALDLLNKLSSPQFDEVLFRYQIPKQYLPPGAQSQRAIAVIELAEQRETADLPGLFETIYRLVPHFAPQAYQTPAPATAPFSPLTPALPPDFVGRENELRQLALWLEEGSSVLIEGDFRIGKSSLLHTWAQQARQSGRYAQVLDGQDSAGASPAALVKLVTGERVAEQPDPAADALKRWASGHSLPPLLLFDEAPAFVRNYPLRFFERLRGMLGRVLVVFASPRDLDALYQERNHTSPLGNALRHLRLGLLEEAAARQLAERSRDPALLRHWAGRHPFYLQLLGAHLASARDTALDEFCDEALVQLHKVWRVLKPAEQRALCAIACGNPVANHRSLRLRGLLNADGSLFGEILRVFLEESCDQ